MIKINYTKHIFILKKLINPRFYRGFFRLSSYKFFLGALGFVFILPSCNEMDSIGLDLIDNRIQLSTTDTVTVIAYTQKEDSLSVSGADFHLLGFTNDPLFGKVKASIFTEALPSSLPPTVVSISPDSLVIDSVILSLAYAGYAGDLQVAYNVRVHELMDVIPLDSLYSNTTIETKREITINNPVLQPMNPQDTLYLGDDSIMVPAQARLSLDQEFGRRFIVHMDSLNGQDAGYSTNDQFRQYFKGFLIEVDEPELSGSMLFINLTNSNSRFQIYYRKLGSETQYAYVMPLGDALGRRFTNFDNFQDQFSSNLINEQLQGDTLKGDSLLFIQSMATYRTKIQLPHFTKFIEDQNNEIAINSARLILPVEESMLPDSTFKALSLILFAEDPETPGRFVNLEDQFVTTGYFGGNLDEEKMNYSFNITKHLQSILDDPSKITPLYLRVSGSFQNAGRIVLKGPGRQNPLRLEIHYTQIVDN